LTLVYFCVKKLPPEPTDTIHYSEQEPTDTITRLTEMLLPPQIRVPGKLNTNQATPVT